MSELHPADASPSPEAARTLIGERDRLRSWLEQLDAHGAEVPAHVLDRVRGDYQERLQRVTAELGEHLGALHESLAELRELQGMAEARHGEARDALAEARLRHLIGELDASAWEERRPALEEAVAGAGRELDEVGTEVSRLEELVREIESAEAAAPPAAAEAEEPGADAGEDTMVALAGLVELEVMEERESAGAGEDDEGVDAAVDELFAVWGAEEEGTEGGEEAALPWIAVEGEEEESEGIELEFLRDVSEPAEAASDETPGGESLTDQAFLEELDRVIASTAPSVAQPSDATEVSENTGLVCKECGASNDARSWYCEICGMELT